MTLDLVLAFHRALAGNTYDVEVSGVDGDAHAQAFEVAGRWTIDGRQGWRPQPVSDYAPNGAAGTSLTARCSNPGIPMAVHAICRKEGRKEGSGVTSFSPRR